MSKQSEKPKNATPMKSGKTNKDGKKTVEYVAYTHRFTAKDIPIILADLKSYKPLIRTADHLDCSYNGLLEFIKRTPVLREAKERYRLGGVDIAESRLMQAIDVGNLNAIMFYLDRMGRDRGYGQHETIETKNKEDTTSRIVIGAIPKEAVEAAKKKVEEITRKAYLDENGNPIPKDKQ